MCWFPRKHHFVRTAYELNYEPSAYGDHDIRISGIWFPIAEGKIYTHAVKWKKVRKAVDVQEATAPLGLGLLVITIPLLKKRTRPVANSRAVKNLQRCLISKI